MLNAKGNQVNKVTKVYKAQEDWYALHVFGLTGCWSLLRDAEKVSNVAHKLWVILRSAEMKWLIRALIWKPSWITTITKQNVLHVKSNVIEIFIAGFRPSKINSNEFLENAFFPFCAWKIIIDNLLEVEFQGDFSQLWKLLWLPINQTNFEFIVAHRRKTIHRCNRFTRKKLQIAWKGFKSRFVPRSGH